MKDRPVLFSASMVLALLAGTKTQTRRICKAAVLDATGDEFRDADGWPMRDDPGCGEVRAGCPYGQPGDHLWVRETWAAPHNTDHLKPSEMDEGWRIHYAATEELGGLIKRPSIFMPRWASRITLEITGVRVERLQDISEADAQAEGIESYALGGRPSVTGEINLPAAYFRYLWESINGEGSWDANPWVWVICFRRVHG